jgi:hypothetical protein
VYEVRHPEMAVPSRSFVTIYRFDADGVAEDFKFVSLIHIVDVEPFDPQATAA